MQNVTHHLQVAFELAVLGALFFSLAFWMGGRKPTNRQMLSWFASCFAIGLLAEFFVTSTGSIYVFLIGSIILQLFPALKRAYKARTLRNSNAFQAQLTFVPQLLKVREKPHDLRNSAGSAR